jgi:hypothetical protein
MACLLFEWKLTLLDIVKNLILLKCKIYKVIFIKILCKKYTAMDAKVSKYIKNT